MSDKRDRKDSSDFSSRNSSRGSSIDQRHYQTRTQYDDDRRYSRNSQSFYDKPRNNEKYHQSSYSSKPRGYDYQQGYENRRSPSQTSSSNSSLSQNTGSLSHRGRSPYESSRHISRYSEVYDKDRPYSVPPGSSIDSDGIRDRRKKIDDYSTVRRKNDFQTDDPTSRFDDREMSSQSYRHDDRRYDKRRFDDRRYEDVRRYDDRYDEEKRYESDRRYEDDIRYDEERRFEEDRRYEDDRRYEEDRRYDSIKGYDMRRRYDGDIMDDDDDICYYYNPRRLSYQKSSNGPIPDQPRKLLPADIVQPVEISPLSFNPGLVEVENKGETLIEVSAILYILEHYIRKKLEFSGKINRYFRLNYCTVIAQFLTATMAQHAIARMNFLSKISKRLSAYTFKIADRSRIDELIIKREEAKKSFFDPPACLVVHNFDLREKNVSIYNQQSPDKKISNFLEPFDIVEYEYKPQKKLLFTYHKNKASVNDFMLAFGEHLSGMQNTTVSRITNPKRLNDNVFKILMHRLIDDCQNDCSELLITDVYIHVLRRERIHQRFLMVSKNQSTPVDRQITGNTFSITIQKNYFINWYVSPARRRNAISMSNLRKKVKTATKERKKEMIKKEGTKYQKIVMNEINEEDSIFAFDKIAHPEISNNSSRLTPIHSIDESKKRGYIKPYALARQQKLIVARESGLTFRQSQFPNTVEQQRRLMNQGQMLHSKSAFPTKAMGGMMRPIVGKRVYFEKSAIQGWGLFALEPICADSFICEYTGDLIRTRVADIREKKYEKDGLPHMYLFRINEEFVVDATMKGGLARFLNHSCHPNCRSKIIKYGNTQTISFYALRNIKPHDEITFNYKMEFEDDKTKSERCYCGAKECIGYLNYCDDPKIRQERELQMYPDESD